MLREAVSLLDVSYLAQIALLLFVVAFAMMLTFTIRMPRRESDQQAALPLLEQPTIDEGDFDHA